MNPNDEHATDLEKRLDDAQDRLSRFYASALGDLTPPVYLSTDLRDAGYKTVNVDTNAFPAGFNNLCPGDRGHTATALKRYFATHHPGLNRLLLLPENHTRNPFYLHNVYHLSKILEHAGIDHELGSADPEVVYAVQGTATPDGHLLQYQQVACTENGLVAGGKSVDLVLSNNDLTTGLPTPLTDCNTPTIPSPVLGWDTRTKTKHFRLYNHLAKAAADIAGLEPWRFTVETEAVGPVDFKKREGLEELAGVVDTMLENLRERNEQAGLESEAKVFIKDAAGTYGMGIFVAGDGDDVRTMNNRARQKMDKGKYGHKVRDVIVQEGVETTQQVEGSSAETVAYLVGTEPTGAFMRLHEKRDTLQNLNQPGMRFLPVCMHDTCDDPQQPDCVERRLTHREATAARLAALALAHESDPQYIERDGRLEIPLPSLD